MAKATQIIKKTRKRTKVKIRRKKSHKRCPKCGKFY